MTPRTHGFALALVVAVAVLSAGCTGPLGGDATPTAEPTPTATDATTETGATPTPTGIHASYEQTTVTVVDTETGDELGRVEAAIADNGTLRATGLSETDSMPDDRGMLFLYDTGQDLTFWMKNMSFGLDILFVHGNGTIESIHHAPEPEAGEDGTGQTYAGQGQYVLEVNRGWADERGVEAGDRIEFDRPE
ncbi:DUF192 domain-containing protein [Natronomonas marina]|uniref:DUF192 domain-containing protein n=1 Tax=Natronomonas marina TaxID=2961939 RepID=UPI0020C9FF72|nr:DUF192 domain-containing protein [Natronomonas marina]